MYKVYYKDMKQDSIHSIIRSPDTFMMIMIMKIRTTMIKLKWCCLCQSFIHEKCVNYTAWTRRIFLTYTIGFFDIYCIERHKYVCKCKKAYHQDSYKCTAILMLWILNGYKGHATKNRINKNILFGQRKKISEIFFNRFMTSSPKFHVIWKQCLYISTCK